MKTRLKRWLQDRRGQTLVEFALIVPVLMLIILGVIEFGRLLYGFSTLQNAARHAADVASKNPPHIGEPVVGDPLGRVNATDDPECGQDGEEPCYLANIREEARHYAALFTPQDPNIHVYFLPANGIVTNEVGGLVEVQIEYGILPITPILKDIAPMGVPVLVDSRRTIVNVTFPSEELLTPIAGSPSPTPPPTAPTPGCGGKYTMQGEEVGQNKYRFQITNVSAGNGGDGQGRGIVGLIVGWCAPDLGQLLSVTVGGVPLPGLPAGSGSVSLPGGSVRLREGETQVVEMTFEHNINPSQTERWPAWHVTFDDYCMLWSAGGRNCPFPTGTPLPSLTPTNTPSPTGSPTPWPTGTVPPVCGMYIQSGPVFGGNTVDVQLYNGGTTSPNLTSVVVMWGSGWRPLREVRWNGQTVWTGTKYYSAYLPGLVGDFPQQALRRLEFIFDSGPIPWLSFQVSFDNNCFVSYSDPFQPTAPPLPTFTPTPVPGWIFLEITDLAPAPPACATGSLNAKATAYYPPAGYQDGVGIQRVAFRIYNPSGTMVYERLDSGSPYCLYSGCGPMPLGTTWPWGSPQAPIVSGTHTLEVTAYTTSAWGSYQRTERTTFEVCREPLHVEVQFAPGGCATGYINVRAIAWDPATCGGSCSDGNGISRIYFDVSRNSQLVYRRSDTSSCYCASNGGCCNNVDFSSGYWPVSDVGGSAVVSGSHTLTVRVQASSGQTAQVSQNFDICWDPCSVYRFVDESKTSARQLRVRIRNVSPATVFVTRVHVSDWLSSVWGQLQTIQVIGSNYNVYVNAPPADKVVSVQFVGDGQNKSVLFNFLNNIGTFDPNTFSGYIELENGCHIDY